jgi:hypothetical protein
MRISDFTLLDTTGLIIETNTDPFQIEHLLGYSISVAFTGDSNLTGSFVIQASNDDSSWNNVASSAFSGTTGNCMFNASNTFYKSVRLKIDVDTGTMSTVIAKIYTKGW